MELSNKYTIADLVLARASLNSGWACRTNKRAIWALDVVLSWALYVNNVEN